eukprot:CAMPEP_0204354894 /NCGR_PEP_ID=MMETSP0469-20131031/33729_1 /ASSEMBLY_ACC=CAM_ASM_000384 /TAXON_ID=2969 /ORGANISM="Oxyrrhis marina" /LENGTH=357 /DNA_ID=CAMNT_0051342057 /DNA_START=46 /DNA_END=1119 /DNA_ORIENTATION=+
MRAASQSRPKKTRPKDDSDEDVSQSGDRSTRDYRDTVIEGLQRENHDLKLLVDRLRAKLGVLQADQAQKTRDYELMKSVVAVLQRQQAEQANNPIIKELQQKLAAQGVKTSSLVNSMKERNEKHEADLEELKDKVGPLIEAAKIVRESTAEMMQQRTDARELINDGKNTLAEYRSLHDHLREERRQADERVHEAMEKCRKMQEQQKAEQLKLAEMKKKQSDFLREMNEKANHFQKKYEDLDASTKGLRKKNEAIMEAIIAYFSMSEALELPKDVPSSAAAAESLMKLARQATQFRQAAQPVDLRGQPEEIPEGWAHPMVPVEFGIHAKQYKTTDRVFPVVGQDVPTRQDLERMYGQG